MKFHPSLCLPRLLAHRHSQNDPAVSEQESQVMVVKSAADRVIEFI